MSNKMTAAQLQKVKDVMSDPVKWSQVFVTTFDAVLKRDTPWTARWYQAEMLRDKTKKKVYRCGRRTGKTETMVLDMLHRVSTNKNYRCLTVTPYENQVRLQFQRLKELIEASPLIKKEVVTMTKNPYQIVFKNSSAIFGFTTGSGSGNAGASIRGQRADHLYLDEVDYMGDADFDAVTAIAAERNDIGITMSSTPTGRRGQFWKACTNPKMGFQEHYHPSTHNPNWGDNMEAEFRAQLSEQGYVHEVLAEFGVEDAGVFNKDKVDEAMTYSLYAYNELDYYQKQRCLDNNVMPTMYLYEKGKRAHINPFRTMGVDWDKYNASSSIIILEYDMMSQKFRVIKRVEVPRSEYSYDNAVNLIVELNEQYNPAFIYCDAGAGEYQIERLHIIGEQQPHTGLKNKVKRINFKQNLEIVDPVTGQINKECIKPFMVTQLQIAFERSKIMLSPYDETLHKQLIDYTVEKISQSGQPVFCSENEHFVDALGLSYLAMVLEFKDLTNMMKDYQTTTKIEISNRKLTSAGLNELFDKVENTNKVDNAFSNMIDKSDKRGDTQTQFKVSQNYRRSTFAKTNWGSRRTSSSLGGNRSSW